MAAVMYPILPGLPMVLDAQKKKASKYDSKVGEYFTWKWGWRINPVTNEKQWHNGNDLPASTGTAIFSPWVGVITRVAYDDVSGNNLKVAHNASETGGISETTYCHLSRVNVSSGQGVVAGQQIAEVGSTGRSTGPHLHFITRTNTPHLIGGEQRQDVDPLPFLEQAAEFAEETGAGGGMSLVTAFVVSAALFYVALKYI